MTTRDEIVAADKRHVWHPYTQMSDYIERVEPLVIARAEGARLHDADGKSYLDGNASWWVAALGHNHPRLVEALTRQARELCHTSLAGVTHEQAALLARELCEVSPRGLSRVFYTDDGSTAVEASVKLAAQYFAQQGRPQKRRFVALEGAFHGDTIGAASLGGVEVFRRPFAGLLFDCVRVPSPGDEGAYEQAFGAMMRAVDEGEGELCAVVLEPLVQGAAGMRTYDPAFIKALRARCTERDVLLIADEVFTGYGRTGTFWACDQAGVSPDLLCTAKGFTGGMLPMGAVLTTERVFEGFLGERSRAFFYGHSFCGNPLGAAVAREVLRVMRDERVIEGIAERASRIASVFGELGKLEGVRGARQLGMIGALDMPSGGEGYLSSAGWRVYDEARRRGAYVRPLGDVVYVTPPLNIALGDLDELLSIVAESVRAAIGAG